MGPLHMGVHRASYMPSALSSAQWGLGFSHGLPRTVVLGWRQTRHPNLPPLFLPHQTWCWYNHRTAWNKSSDALERSPILGAIHKHLVLPFSLWGRLWTLPVWPPLGYVTGGATGKETWFVRALSVQNTWAWRPRGANSPPLSREQRGLHVAGARDHTRVFHCLGQNHLTKIQFFWHMVMRNLFPSYLIIKVFLVSGFIWGRLSDL